MSDPLNPTITYEQAVDAHRRYMNMQFKKGGEQPVAHIPAQPDSDTDLVLGGYLRQSREQIGQLTRDLAAANARVAELEAADASNKLAIERNWTFSPEHLNTVRNDPVPITARLRGDYGSRSFPASAISIVAADMLDAANKELSRLRTQVAACASDAKASLRMVRFDGQSVWGDYYTDEPEGD